MTTSTQRRVSDPSVEQTVADYLAMYGAPDASAAELLVDRHDPDAVAFTVIADDLSSRDLTYGELAEESRRFARALVERGVTPGAQVATLAGKSLDLVVAVVGIWRAGAVHVPLFTAFATPAIELRLSGSGARVVIADPGQRSKLDPIEGLTVIETGEEFAHVLAQHEPEFDAVAVGGDGMIVQIFTSGTTGTPKGVPVPLRAIASFRSYLHFGLEVTPDDVYWNIADPGWAYGLYYGIIATLAEGTRNLLLSAPFDAALAASVIKEFGVTNLAAAPTVYRSLIHEQRAQDLSLRRASAAGEPLTADILTWSRERLGFEVRDHYGQTELGMVVANAWHSSVENEIVHGSMGTPLPGFEVTVLDGEVALDIEHSPLYWFTGYVDAPERTKERYSPDGKWYLTSDVAQQNPDGLLFFASRADDIILMAGYRIGPFEVESVLLADDAVAEAAVVGAPDQRLGEALVAYVVLAEGFEPSDELTVHLQQRVKKGFAAHAYPRRIRYIDSLPKTPRGKVQRHLLRQREDALDHDVHRGR